MKRAALLFAATGLAGLFGPASFARGATASFASPYADKWMYANAESAGAFTEVAPVFAFLGTSEDEDRMGAILLAFDTATLVPANRGVGAYAVTSVKFSITVRTGDTFLYDPTHDSYRTYLPVGNPLSQADTDTGRPVELFGVGLRNGYTGLKGSISGGPTPYLETSPFGTAGQATFRNAYPIGLDASGVPYDVADNISQEKEATPFAVGTTTDATPGGSVPEGALFTFQLQLSDAAIRSYVQAGLNAGVLGLYVSSLHSATGQTGPQTYPRFLTREGAAFLDAPEYAPQLQITYTLVPEPTPTLWLVLGLAVFTAGRAFHRRRHF
jgi:hypothetical protein